MTAGFCLFGCFGLLVVRHTILERNGKPTADISLSGSNTSSNDDRIGQAEIDVIVTRMRLNVSTYFILHLERFSQIQLLLC